MREIQEKSIDTERQHLIPRTSQANLDRYQEGERNAGPILKNNSPALKPTLSWKNFREFLQKQTEKTILLVSWGLREAAFPAVFLLIVLAVWETFVRVAGVPSYILPPPSTIGQTAIREMNSLSLNLLVTMGEAIAGFCLGNLIGFAVAILFAHSQVAEKAIYPYAIALKTTPVVALAPLLVVWFGTGPLSKIIAAAVICFFPIVVNAARGLRAADRETLDLFHSLTATKVQIFFKLRLPTSLPYVFSALKISSSLSVVGAIVGEFVGAQRGLGYLILVSSYHLETDLMFASVIAAAFGGITFFAVVSVLEKIFVPWATGQEQ